MSDQITSLIRSSNLTNNDLVDIIEAVKYKRSLLARQTKATISLGDNVKFTSSKTGRLTQGIVKKIAIKYITVDAGTMVWRVPANMLEIV